MTEFKDGDRVLVDAEYVENGDPALPREVVCRGHRFFVEPSDIRPYTDPAEPPAHPLDAVIAELGELTGLTGGDLSAAVDELVYNAIRRIRAAATRVIDARSAALEEIDNLLGRGSPSVLDHVTTYVDPATPINPFGDEPPRTPS